MSSNWPEDGEEIQVANGLRGSSQPYTHNQDSEALKCRMPRKTGLCKKNCKKEERIANFILFYFFKSGQDPIIGGPKQVASGLRVRSCLMMQIKRIYKMGKFHSSSPTA